MSKIKTLNEIEVAQWMEDMSTRGYEFPFKLMSESDCHIYDVEGNGIQIQSLYDDNSRKTILMFGRNLL